MATKVEAPVAEVPVEAPAAAPVTDHQQSPSQEDSLNADQK